MSNPLEGRSLYSMAWPLVISIGFGIALPIIDSLFLSRISDSAAAAVGALGVVLFVAFTAIQALSQAGTSIALQYQGAGKKAHVHAAWNMILVFSTVIGVLIGGIFYGLHGMIGAWMGLEGEALQYSAEYMAVLGPAMPARALYMSLTGIANARGLTQWNLYANLFTLVMNSALNGAFIFGWLGFPKWGVTGVGIATGATWVVASCLLWIALHNHSYLGIHRKHLKRSIGLIVPNWVRIGAPAAAEPVSFQLHQVVITSLVVRLGTIPTAARVYAANLALLPVIFSLGVGFAAATLISNDVGSRNFKQADKHLKYALFSSAGIVFVISLGIALAAPWLLGFFTENPDVIKLGVLGLWVDAALQPAKAANIVLSNALRGTGDSRFTAVTGMAMMWSIGISTAYILGYGFDMGELVFAGYGMVGLWAGMAVDEWTRFAVYYKRWKSGKWQKHRDGILREKRN